MEISCASTMKYEWLLMLHKMPCLLTILGGTQVMQINAKLNVDSIL